MSCQLSGDALNDLILNHISCKLGDVIAYTFISYAHEDTHFALKLAYHLKRHNLAVRIDQWDVPPEADWDKAIERMIRSCDHFLVILSPAAINSWVVREQWSGAAEAGKTIIPILYQSCKLPASLQHIPYVDFTTGDYNRALEQLLVYYFPDLDLESGKWPRLKLALTGWTRRQFNSLLPLLWPGWVGPAIVLLLFFFGAILYWQSERDVAVSPQPRFETLIIVGPTATPLPTPVATRVRARDNQLMVEVPAGEFLMGGDQDDPTASDDELPPHWVYLDTFWIDETEITAGQYRACVEAEFCAPPQTRGVRYQQCVEDGVCPPLEVEGDVAPEDILPVAGVTWEQATTYCTWVGARLPTEAEWEKAARGTDGRRYPWGNNFDGKRLNYCDKNCVADWRDLRTDDGYRYMAPTGSYPAGASPYGVLDMSGNVWEWTADWYDAGTYANSTYRNPAGPDTGRQRVIRGGSWSYHPKSLRITKRHRDTPTTGHENNGFRCAVADKVTGN